MSPAERPGTVPGIPPDGTSDGASSWSSWDEPAEPWMLPGGCPSTSERTLLLEMAARILFPTVLVFSMFLLLEGHYGPGGGFSGGLVAGLAFVLRHIAGGDGNLGARVRIRPPVVIGGGLTIAVLTGLAPIAFGAPVLSSAKVTLDLPLAGEVDLVSSLLLDLGVYLLIIGVVLDLLRSLGSGIERDARDAAGDTG